MSSFFEKEYIHVVLGIIVNSRNEVLLSKRHINVHQGGLLEFPGGKVNKNELPSNALKRELLEEVNVHVDKVSPLIQIPYTYSDHKVFLDVYLIKEYSGVIQANEDQEIFWNKIDTLNVKDFPEANIGILNALQLPKVFPITPEYETDSKFLNSFEKVVVREGTEIIVLRCHKLDSLKYAKLVKKCIGLCKKNNVKLILNRDENIINSPEVSGIHLTSKHLLSTTKKPINYKIVGASCHNVKEVKHANNLKLDYIFIGPVIEKNASKENTLGWDRFAELCKISQIPVYAIGGLGEVDSEISVQHGGQGIAAIRSIWYSRKQV